MRSTTSGVWETYRVKEKRLYVGSIKDYMVRDMEFEYNGARIRLNGQEYPDPNLRGAIRKGWIVKVEPEAIPIQETSKSLIDRSIEAKQKSIHVLPEGWSNLHWKHKLSFIESCVDEEILQNIRRAEARTVKKAAEDRLELLKESSSEEEAPKVVKKAPKRGPETCIDVTSDADLSKAINAEVTPTGGETKPAE